MTGASSVHVRPATQADRTALEGLAQFYMYDFWEFARDPRDFAFNRHGQFDAHPQLSVDLYLEADDRWPLIISVGDRLAGFALINAESHKGGRVERNMGEFFVARGYRRNGVATAAFHQILRHYPGQWEIAVSERNAPALAFWPRAIAAAPNVTDLTQAQGDGVHWRGPIWSFRAD